MMTDLKNQKQPFAISCYDCIGFDMDHTLVQYKLPRVMKLSYKALVTYLVNVKGYNQCLLDDGFEQFEDFCFRGLVFESKAGNFFKVGKDGVILRASHGTKEIPHEELIKTYGTPPIWPHFNELQEKCYHGVHFRIFENFHDIPAAVVCARLVDILDKKNGPVQSYGFWNDVVEALNENYQTSSFKNRRGIYFPSIVDNPEIYVKKCSQDVIQWIQSLKDAGKIIFLMTSSFVDYTVFLMKYAIGDNWQEMFDFVVTNARKPRFFEKDNANHPFYITGKDHLEHGEATVLHSHEIYSQGNATLLHKLVDERFKKKDMKFLYFGDSLKSDVFPPYAYAGWDTVVILEEMEAEDTHHKNAINSENENSNGVCMKKPRYQECLNREEKLIIASKQWGSFFYHVSNNNNDETIQCNTSKLNTYWANVIASNSRLAIPTLDYLTELPLDHVFTSFCEETQFSFYPHAPGAMK